MKTLRSPGKVRPHLSESTPDAGITKWRIMQRQCEDRKASGDVENRKVSADLQRTFRVLAHCLNCDVFRNRSSSYTLGQRYKNGVSPTINRHTTKLLVLLSAQAFSCRRPFKPNAFFPVCHSLIVSVFPFLSLQRLLFRLILRIQPLNHMQSRSPTTRIITHISCLPHNRKDTRVESQIPHIAT